MGTVARWLLAACAASGIALGAVLGPAGCSDAASADGGGDGTAPRPTTGRDTDPGALNADASRGDAGPVAPPPDAGGDVPPIVLDAGPSYSRCGLTDTSDAGLDAAAIWPNDFATGSVVDPAGDDDGYGNYVYPEDVDPSVDGSSPRGGVADITSFALAYSAATQELSFEVSVRTLTEHTRIGVVLLDDAHFPSPDAGALPAERLEWAVTGNELRVPNWTKGGLTLLLAKPGTPTFNLAVRRDLAGFGSETRPDNAAYFERGTWLDCRGAPSSSRFDILELPVGAQGNALSFRMPARVLEGQIDLRSPKLYAIVYSYLLVDRARSSDVEFGALEITETLGGLPESSTDSWRDPDTFDLAFVTGDAQRKLLTPPPVPDGGFTADDATKLVVIKDVGRGVLAIDTSAMR